jgi:hypothetical protein
MRLLLFVAPALVALFDCELIAGVRDIADPEDGGGNTARARARENDLPKRAHQSARLRPLI